MRTTTVGVHLLSFTLLAVSGCGGTSVPIAQISTSSLDLGDGAPSESKNGVLVVSNTGTSPLHFTVTKSCGCTGVTPMRGTIEPGKSVDLAVTLSLPDYVDTEKTAQVIVKSDDPIRPTIPCAVTARVPASLSVTPSFLDFGKVLANRLSDKSLSLGVTAKEGKQDVVVQVAGPFAATLEGERLVCRIGKPDLSPGEHSGVIELFPRSNENAKHRIPVRIHVTSGFEVIPPNLIIRRDATGGATEAKCLASVLPEFGPLDDVAIVDGPAGVSIAKVAKIDSTRSQFKVIVDSSANLPPKTTLTIQSTPSGLTSQLNLLEASQNSKR